MGGLIFVIVLGIIFTIAGFFGIGFGICDEEGGIGAVSAVVAAIGLCCIIGVYKEFYDMRKTPVSECISDNIETVEEVKTNGELVEYKITLKDSTKFSVVPPKEDK